MTPIYIYIYKRLTNIYAAKETATELKSTNQHFGNKEDDK